MNNTVRDSYKQTMTELDSYGVSEFLSEYVLSLPRTDNIKKLVDIAYNVIYTGNIKHLKYKVVDNDIIVNIIMNPSLHVTEERNSLLNLLFNIPQLLFDMSTNYGIDILNFIHENRLAVSNMSYFLILVSINYNDKLSETEITHFNDLLQKSFPYLPDVIQDIVINWCVYHTDKYKLDKFVNHLQSYINHITDDETMIILLESGNEMIVEVIRQSILFNNFKKSYIEYKSSLNDFNIHIIKKLYSEGYLTDEYVLETMDKFSLDTLHCLLHFNFKHETLNKLRQFIIKKTGYNYFNPKDWRMISNETKINYLKDFFQIEEDGTIIAYLFVDSNNNFKIRVNGGQLVECNNDYYHINYSPYHIDYSHDYFTEEHPVDIEPIVSAYNNIKHGNNVIEVLVNVMDILEVNNGPGKISFGATRFEFGDYPTSSQLSAKICQKYKVSHPKHVKLSTKHLEVNEESELLKFKMNFTTITHNINISTTSLTLKEFKSKLFSMLKKFNEVIEYKYRYIIFVDLGNLLMNNALLTLDYPSLLETFITKRDEFILTFPDLIDFDIPLSILKNYILEHEKYYMQPIFQQIFNIQIENKEGTKLDNNINEILNDKELIENNNTFNITDSKARKLTQDEINDITNIIKQNQISHSYESVQELLRIIDIYLSDGGLLKGNWNVFELILTIYDDIKEIYELPSMYVNISSCVKDFISKSKVEDIKISTKYQNNDKIVNVMLDNVVEDMIPSFIKKPSISKNIIKKPTYYSIINNKLNFNTDTDTDTETN
jgi:hypothetical protein